MCALFGIHDYGNCFNSRQKELILKVLSVECEVRGKDATGIGYVKNRKLQICKRPVPAHEMRYRIPPKVKVIMGHTRFTTQGSERNNYNNHPFVGRAKNNMFILAHNGVLHNDKALRQTMKLAKTHVETDSYIAVQLIERENSVTFESLRKMAESVTGSFVFTVLDKHNNLYFIKGDNPICIYHFIDEKFYLYASTEDILMKTISRLGIDKYRHERIHIETGDILRIDDNGDMEREQFEATELYTQMHGYYRYPVYIYERRNSRSNDSGYNEYLAMLKQISGLYGYTPDAVDELLSEGWTPEDIEQILYSDSIYREAVSENWT